MRLIEFQDDKFGQAVRAELMRRGIAQLQMMRDTGVCKTTVFRLLSDDRQCRTRDISSILSIATYLGMDLRPYMERSG